MRATAYAAPRALPHIQLGERRLSARTAWVVTQGFHKYGTVVLCACSAHLLRFEIGIERTAREGVFITNEDIMSQVH